MSTKTDIRNQWVLLDAQGRLLTIADIPYSAVAPRQHIDPYARKVLLPMMQEAIATGEPVEHVDGGVLVSVFPIKTAKTGSLVAVQGIYREITDKMAARPVVGGWEWLIENAYSDDRKISIFWNDEMFTVYDLDRDDPQFAHIDNGVTPMPNWLNYLIAFEKRTEMYTYLQEWIKHPGNTVPIFRYGIIKGLGKVNPSPTQLRFAGDGFRDGTTLWLRGITHEDPTDGGHVIPDFTEVRSETVLHAAFDLTDDVLALIDTSTWVLFMWSPSWTKVSLADPGNGSLLNVLNLNDLGIVQQSLVAAARGRSAPGTPGVVARFRMDDGRFQPFQLRATGVDVGTVKGDFVLARLTPASDTPTPTG